MWPFLIVGFVLGCFAHAVVARADRQHKIKRFLQINAPAALTQPPAALVGFDRILHRALTCDDELVSVAAAHGYKIVEVTGIERPIIQVPATSWH